MKQVFTINNNIKTYVVFDVKEMDLKVLDDTGKDVEIRMYRLVLTCGVKLTVRYQLSNQVVGDPHTILSIYTHKGVEVDTDYLTDWGLVEVMTVN